MFVLLFLVLHASAGTQVQNSGNANDLGAEMPVDSRFAGAHYGWRLYLHLGATYNPAPPVTWEVELLVRAAAKTSRAAFDTQVAGTAMATWYAARTEPEKQALWLSVVRVP